MGAPSEAGKGTGSVEGAKAGDAGAAAAAAAAANGACAARAGAGGAAAGIAVLPTAAGVPVGADQPVTHDAKRARTGEAPAEAAAPAAGMPAMTAAVPVATVYSGDVSQLQGAQAVEVLQSVPAGNVSQLSNSYPPNIPQSFQTQYNQQGGTLPGQNAPAGGIQPQSVSVAQDSVTADVVLALCGMRDSSVGNGNSQYGWEATQSGNWPVPTPKRASNGRAGKRNLSSETVNILKQWYDEHQDWPYPNDTEQDTLSQKTGIPSKMVNTWFINARKRRKQQAKAGGVPPNGNRVKRKGGCGIVHNSAFSGVEGYDSALSSPHAGVMSSAAAISAPHQQHPQQGMSHAAALSGLQPVPQVALPQVGGQAYAPVAPAPQGGGMPADGVKNEGQAPAPAAAPAPAPAQPAAAAPVKAE